MILRDKNNQESVIPQLQQKDSRKTLGHFKDVAENSQIQLQKLASLCKRHVGVIKGAYLTHFEASVYYTTIFLPSMTYPLSNTYLSEKAYSKIQTLSVNPFPQAMGFSRSTDQRIVYGPRAYGALGMAHLYNKQGILQITQFLDTIRQPHTIQGQLLQIVIEWAQLISGVGFPILEFPDIELPHLKCPIIETI